MEKWRAWEWLLALLMPVAGAFLGIVAKGLYDSKFKRIDEADRIRKELREELGNLRKYFEELQELRIRFADLDIAYSRSLSRLEECVDFISRLLEAEQCLAEHHEKEARMLLRLVDRDRKMREQMELEEKQREITRNEKKSTVT